MSKTKKVEARVQVDRHTRYERAREVLRLEQMSDFVRRACDDLAARTLDVGENVPAKEVRASSATISGDGRTLLGDGRRVKT